MADNGSVTVKVERWGEFQKRYTAKVAREVRTGAMIKAGPIMALMLGVESIKRGIYDQGHFSDKWQHKLVEAQSALRISNATRYGYNIEMGRKPGARQPPAHVNGKLYLWVRRRLGVVDPKMTRKIVFFVARKIARRGIKARKVLLDPKYQQVLANVLLKYIEQGFSVVESKGR